MKQLQLLLLLVLISYSGWTQDTVRLNYQGVALHANATPIANATISIRTQIYQAGASTFQNIYEETRMVNTDSHGYFDFQIGSNGAISSWGSLKNIFPSTGKDHYMKIEMDPNGGTNFTTMGTQKLASVPLAVSSLVTDSLALPFKGNDATINSFIVENNYNGAGVAIIGRSYEDNVNAVGIFGEVPLGNLNGSGVRGRSWSPNAIGVEGVGQNGIGVKGRGTSAGGVGVLAENTNVSGKALVVNGNLKISGGNTNPSAGALLSSDASGNAVWKNQKIGFVASSNTSQNCPHQTLTFFSLNEEYDGSGNFNPSTAPTNSNSFIAPVSGLYHFTAYVTVQLNSLTENINYAFIALNKNGANMFLSRVTGPWNTISFSNIGVSLDRDVYLNAGDVIKVGVGQVNSAGGNNLAAVMDEKYFSGHLVYAD